MPEAWVLSGNGVWLRWVNYVIYMLSCKYRGIYF